MRRFYLDQASDGITVAKNVGRNTSGRLVYEQTNANGTGTNFISGNSTSNPAVEANAGIEAQYQYIKSKVPPAVNPGRGTRVTAATDPPPGGDGTPNLPELFRIENKARTQWLQNLTTADGAGSTICGNPGINVRGVNTNKTGDATKWELVAASSGYNYIRNVARNSYLQLTYDVNPDPSGPEDCGTTYAVRGVSVADNCTGDWTQWKLVDAGNGYVRLENKGNGFWLQMPDITDIDDGSLDGGLQVRAVSNCKTGDATRWRLVAVTNSTALKVTLTDDKEVNDNIEELFTFYPNPTKNGIYINVNNDLVDVSKIALFDVYGKVIYTTTITSNSTEIELNGYPTGVYFVSVENIKGKSVKKIILE